MEKIPKKERSKDFLEALNQLENKGLPDLLIIDLDGVLVEVSLNIFVKGLVLYLTNKEEFQKFVDQHKIPLTYLRKLADLAKKTKVIILTNRFLKSRGDNLKNIFPFISQELIEKFKTKFDIEVIAQASKPQINPQLEEFVSQHKRVTYVGSSKLDEFTAKNLKKINPNIEYLQVSTATFI